MRDGSLSRSGRAPTSTRRTLPISGRPLTRTGRSLTSTRQTLSMSSRAPTSTMPALSMTGRASTPSGRSLTSTRGTLSISVCSPTLTGLQLPIPGPELKALRRPVRLRARELESVVDYLHMRTILLNTVVVLFAVSPLFALDWLRSRSRWIAQYHDELSLVRGYSRCWLYISGCCQCSGVSGGVRSKV